MTKKITRASAHTRLMDVVFAQLQHGRPALRLSHSCTATCLSWAGLQELPKHGCASSLTHAVCMHCNQVTSRICRAGLDDLLAAREPRLRKSQ